TRTDADIVTLDRADEAFGHSIALWAFDWRCRRFEAEVASKAACLAGEVTAAIVGQPLDGDRQAIDRAEAMLDGSEHQITNILAADAAGGGEETHGLAITAIEREGDPARVHRCRSQSQSRRSTSGGCAHRRRCGRHGAARCR